MLEQAVLVFAAISAIGSACGDHAITTTELFRFRHDPETPCVRIPSLVTVPGGVVVALAECRQFVGDGCRPWDDDNASLRNRAGVQIATFAAAGALTTGVRLAPGSTTSPECGPGIRRLP